VSEDFVNGLIVQHTSLAKHHAEMEESTDYVEGCNQPICHPIWFEIFGISSLIPKSETE
jgi:hypothetical protein